ncbi:class I SAM-dependent methyltransferase [Acuticoccus yangtzensis]|uniref:class I SAM-dependent methyltransferase n=1 Tax=Acuticoccus yangtzensis TaxID=1443441 RepID=UPI00094956BA|nr:class I SAM-dependent methyltransferase [Acuticoccus yangtzensis]ORE90296.1 phosphatidylethanolamine-N-methyltransferase (pmtA) [Stappia sp. 22II-S9-Z10]
MTTSTNRSVEGRDVKTAYARWAPIYEFIATPTVPARKIAAKRVNAIGGRFLEAGVGSGSALPLYGDNVDLVGVDLSHDMLKIARGRVDAGLKNVEAILEMDLMNLAFADASFDGVVCMFTITAVPDAAQVMREFARVVKPGGIVMIASHFEADKGPWQVTDRVLTPFAKRLGWNPSMPIDGVMETPGLVLESREELPPVGLITLLNFRRTA